MIKDFKKCDFTPIYEWHQRRLEAKKAMTKEEKKVLISLFVLFSIHYCLFFLFQQASEAQKKLAEPYMYAMVDGHKEKVGNFRVEPPGLFQGRGKHPLQGRVKV